MSSNPEIQNLQIPLTTCDRNILDAVAIVVDGIALFLGEGCEVALHSLENPEKALIKIVNNHHTRREVGAPLTDHGAQLILDYKENKGKVTSTYTTTSASGDPMRSVFTVITNEEGPIGLLGINFNMNIPLAEFLSTFSLFNRPVARDSQTAAQSTANSIDDLVYNAVNKMVHKISSDTGIPNHEKNKYIVFGLQENGIFEIKGAVVQVAEELHLSKFTIYSYIRELKEKNRKS